MQKTAESIKASQDYQISNREFLKLLELTFLVTVGLPIMVQLDQIKYLFDKLGHEPRYYDSTVFLAKLIDREKNEWLTGNGILINPTSILTASHNNIDKSFSYTHEKNIRTVYSRNCQTQNNISEYIKHPSLDLAIVRLIRPENINISTKIRKVPVSINDGPLSLATQRDMVMNNVFAGYISEITNIDEFGIQKPTDSIIITNNNAAITGDSGSALFIDTTGELIGICFGGKKSKIAGLRPKSYFCNLTNPDTQKWIYQNSQI